MPVLLQMTLVTLFFFVAHAVSRRRPPHDGYPSIFGTFWANLGRTFVGYRSVFYLSAVAVTAVMVVSGWDRTLQDLFQSRSVLDQRVSTIALIAGNFWTLVVALAIYAVARAYKRRELRGCGVASLQAVLSTFLVTTVLKGLSGRRGPEHVGEHTLHAPFLRTDDPSDFAFDFWNHAVMDGRFFWPSGHTASSIALVSALVAYYPDKRWLAWVGYPIVVFMALAMVDGDFHWVSDIFAGALIGHVIGWTVGKRVRREAG